MYEGFFNWYYSCVMHLLQPSLWVSLSLIAGNLFDHYQYSLSFPTRNSWALGIPSRNHCCWSNNFFPPSTISSTSTERLDQTNTISKTANRGKFNLCSFCVWYLRDYLFLQFQKKEKKYSKALSCGIKLSDQQQDMGGEGTSARTEEVLCWVVIETIKLLSLAC